VRRTTRCRRRPAARALAEQVAALRAWDLRWAASSVPTSLAVFWGEELMAPHGPARRRAERGMRDVYDYMATRRAARSARGAGRARRPADARLRHVAHAVGRDQPLPAPHRRHRAAVRRRGPSLPVPFTSATWGSLASFGQRGPRTTKRIYGNRGNSFVAGGGVRAARAGQERARRRRERRPGVAALQPTRRSARAQARAARPRARGGAGGRRAGLDAALDDHVGDDLLRLVFTACHPVLSTEARVALTLRCSAG
jgi:hypothetical protein